MGRVSGAVVALLLVLPVGACADGGGVEVEVEPDTQLTVRSDVLTDGGEVPVAHTCDGADVPPALAWSDVPDEAVEVVVVVDDPDAPAGTFTHWTVWGLAPEDTVLEGALPPGALEGENDFADVGYRGPCPPEGDEPHRYRFRVLAVSAPVDLPEGASPDELVDALADTVVAEGVLTATYAR